jgi:3-oxoisoapionate decarboxylase
MNRRHFLQSAAVTTAASALNQVSSLAAAASTKPLIGLDHFAVRAAGMKAPALIDYAASIKVDALFISELGPLESLEDDYLKKLKAQADAKGLKLYSGGMSICKSSNTYKPEQGDPIAYTQDLVRVAKALGSPVARCVLGNAKDRTTDGGIEKHIEECIRVLKAVKNLCETEEVKIAIENHAGDMQSQELKALIEAAGKGHVGANIDPGNAVWALEDPMQNLEVLGPYVICSSIRDSMLWETEEGAMVQWTAVGEGLVDFKAYAKRYAELAPGAPLNVETISGFAKPFAYQGEEFWAPYSKATAASFAGWVALTKKGKPLQPFKAPEGPEKKAADIAYQKGELERSIQWLRANV